MKYASIDVGTNAVLLLIVQLFNGMTDIVDISTITRLGEGLEEKRRLSEEAMVRTFHALEKYREAIDENDVHDILCVGTSALREAENSETFLKMVRDRLKFNIRVISSHDEARYTYLSVTKDELIKGENFIIVDIGGGSTEIIKGNGIEPFDFISLPTGTVKLTEMFIRHNPPVDDELSLLTAYTRDLLSRIPFNGCGSILVGTGGTITTMAGIISGLESFDKSIIHNSSIGLNEISRLIDLLKNMEVRERKAIKCMEKGREDILLQGIMLLREIMIYLGIESLIVSTKGVRYGVVYEKLRDV